MTPLYSAKKVVGSCLNSKTYIQLYTKKRSSYSQSKTKEAEN